MRQVVEAGDSVEDVGHHVGLVGRVEEVDVVFLRDKLEVFDWVVCLKRCWKSLRLLPKRGQQRKLELQ